MVGHLSLTRLKNNINYKIFLYITAKQNQEKFNQVQVARLKTVWSLIWKKKTNSELLRYGSIQVRLTENKCTSDLQKENGLKITRFV